MRRGEVRWYRFARPDKRRPVVILTRDPALQFLGEVTIAPITTTVRDIPSEVPLGAADGMPRDCAINLDHLQTVSRGRIESLITTLSAQKLAAVERALLFALGFRPVDGSPIGPTSSPHPRPSPESGCR
jgi:mRNA interferase MazF